MSAVVGFDVGNDSCVIAAAKQRGIDVLLNDESNRETPAVVCFADKQRLIGAAGAASAMMNPKSTVSQLKRLIGRRFDEAGIQDEIRRLPFAVSEGSDGGILIHVRYRDEERRFTPVQVLGMLLVHLKKLAERALDLPVSDCVIGVPSYFTNVQRKAYLDAAAIAGLRPLRLMHDGAATALGYGIYKTDAGPSTFVVFVDIGHCDTQVSVAAFTGGQMRIVAHAFDRDLGGRDFDEVLFQYFAGQFREQYGIDVFSNLRACIRLRAACEKLKRVLSANAEAPINIECLMDEKDVKSFIKRDEFEMLSSGLLERIVAPCKKALHDTRLTVERIHSVELVGSGSRIPAISRVLSEYFKREPSRTLNASECISRGCALQCAMLSPIFRVRDYEVQDSFPFSVELLTDEDPISTSASNIFFQKGQLIPSLKMLTFHRSKTFQLKAIYADLNELPPGASQKASCLTVGPFQAPENIRTKVKVSVRLNLHGTIIVESASLVEDHGNDPGSKVIPHSNSDHVEHGFGSGVSDDGFNATDSGTFTKPGAGISGMRQGGLPQREEIPFTEDVFFGMNKDDLSKAQALEQELEHQDRLVERTKDRKNALEAYVYEIRNKLFERYRSFASDSEKEGISRSLQQTEEWLYEDGDDESEKVYSSKMEDLKKLVDPIENRCKEEEARAQATKELLECIVEHRTSAKSLAAPERDAVINECTKADYWLRDKLEQQHTSPRNTDPILWSSEIRRTTEALNMSYQHIMRAKSSPSRSEDSKSTVKTHPTDDMEID